MKLTTLPRLPRFPRLFKPRGAVAPAPPRALIASLGATLIFGAWFAVEVGRAVRVDVVLRERLDNLAAPAWPELADAFRRGNPRDGLRPPAGDPRPVLLEMLDRPYVTAAFHVSKALKLTWRARGEGEFTADLATWRPLALNLSPYLAEPGTIGPTRIGPIIPGVPATYPWLAAKRRAPQGPLARDAAREAGILALVRDDALRRDAGHAAFNRLKTDSWPRVHAQGDRNHGWIGYTTTVYGPEGQEILDRHGVGRLLTLAPYRPTPGGNYYPHALTPPYGVMPPAIGDLGLWAHGDDAFDFLTNEVLALIGRLAALLVATGVALIASLRQLRKLMQHQALADARGRFVSGMSHEMRTPLTTIKLYAEMLEHGVVAEPAARQGYLATIARECDRLTRMVENVLAYAALESRFKTLLIGPVDARAALHEAVEASRGVLDQAGLRVEVHAPVPLRVAADRDALVLAIANLLTNAAKYAAEGRVVMVSALPAPDGRPEAVIAVRDFGPGIPLGERAKIFEPFYRRRQAPGPGTGLGLALVNETARGHGGRVEVVGEPGEGAEFRLFLPLAPAEVAVLA